MIPVYKPFLTEESKFFAKKAIDDGWISSIGEYKELTTNTFKSIINTPHCLLTNNGTTALHLAIRAIKKFYPNVRKVIVPNHVYVAAWNCLLFDDPNYFQINILSTHNNTWNADYNNLELEDNGDGYLFLVVHNLGNPVNVRELKRKWPKAFFLEDASEGVFGRYEDHHVGTAADIAVFSFFGNKNITCGEGGAIITKYSEIYNFVNKLHGQGQTAERYIHDELGYNYRMTNVAAAILQGQLLNWSLIDTKKSLLRKIYRESFTNLELQHTENNCEHSNWMFGIKFSGPSNRIIAEIKLARANIEFRPMFYPWSKHYHLKTVEANYKIGNYCKRYDYFNEHILILPSYPALVDEKDNLNHIIKTVQSFEY